MDANGWMPIESAPEDAHAILGFSGMWRGNPEIAVYEAMRFGSSKQFGGWAVPGDHEGYHDPPTHWMPLPAPPENADGR